MPEVVVGLYRHPYLGSACPGLLQPDCDVRADPRLAIENPGKGAPGHGQPVSRFGHGQPQRDNDVLPENVAGMRRVVQPGWLLVIVLIIHQFSIGIGKTKSDSPITVHPD